MYILKLILGSSSGTLEIGAFKTKTHLGQLCLSRKLEISAAMEIKEKWLTLISYTCKPPPINDQNLLGLGDITDYIFKTTVNGVWGNGKYHEIGMVVIRWLSTVCCGFQYSFDSFHIDTFVRDVVKPVAAAVASCVSAFSFPPAEAPKSVWLAQPLSPPDLTLQGANGPRCDI